MRFTCTLGLAAALTLGAIAASNPAAHAQATYAIGTIVDTNNAQGYPTPFGDYFEGSRQQFLFRSSELTAAGMSAGTITGLRWNVINLFTGPSSGVHEQWTLKIGTTASTALTPTGWLTGAATVYGPFDYQPVLGQNVFTFTTPFTWNGTSNIYVEVCHGSSTNTTGANQYTANAGVERSSTGFMSSRSYSADNLGNLCNSTSTTGNQNQLLRPVTTFLLNATATCNAPQTVTVAGTGITSTSAKGVWSSVLGSAGYQYAVGTSAIPPSSGTAVLDTSATLIGLMPGTTYYLHVRNACVPGFSSWKTTMFTTYAAGNCAPPDSVTVANITSNGATVNWQATAGSSGYEWVVTMASTPPTVFGWQPVPAGTTTGTSTWLNPSTMYYAHARARCSGSTNTSMAVTSRSFMTLSAPPPTTSVSSTAGATGLSVTVTPNPAHDLLSIDVDGASGTAASLELLDGMGRILRRLPTTGKTTAVSIADLPAGLYLLRYTDAANRAAVRVQKL